MYRTLVTLHLLFIVVSAVFAKTEEGIAYYSDATDAYQAGQCRLDLYIPDDSKGFPTVVWFHGGGMKGGNRYIPEQLKERGIAVAAVSYRLSPKVKAPVYIEDAAAAVAWVIKNITQFGGDPEKIYISGHSAGGYLVAMVGLDTRWLGAHGVDITSLAGVIPFSGQTLTHYTIREERGLPKERPVIDELAPVHHARADAPPFLLITGDRELEMTARYEENAYLYSLMRAAGHKDVQLFELQGYGHGNMRDGGYPLLLKFISER